MSRPPLVATKGAVPVDRPEPDERSFRFALAQYDQISDHVGSLQSEREIWIRHSIIATFAFFGWLAVYRDSLSETFMLGAMQVQSIYFLAVVFNVGGALRFFFIQRDINRNVSYLIHMERHVMALPDWICEAPRGRGLRDRHWHWPSILYWAFIIALSGGVAAFLFLQGHV